MFNHDLRVTVFILQFSQFVQTYKKILPTLQIVQEHILRKTFISSIKLLLCYI